MDRSLRKLAALPDAVVVYNGHGDPTTIGAERGWLPAPD
jgi:glyoxylase-like metal-dependent hydrolase (beta-lactamase superfamily II)